MICNQCEQTAKGVACTVSGFAVRNRRWPNSRTY